MKRTLKRDIPKDYSFLDLVAPSYNRLKITPKFVTGGPLKTSSQFSLNPDPYDTDLSNLFNYNQDGSTSTTTKKGPGTPSKMLMVPGYDPNFNDATTTPEVDQTKLNFMQDPVRNSSINNNNTTTSINTEINRGTPINLRVPEDPNNPDGLDQGVDQRKLNWLQDPVRNKVDQTLVDERVAAADQRVEEERERQWAIARYQSWKASQPMDQPDMDQSDIDRITAEEAAANASNEPVPFDFDLGVLTPEQQAAKEQKAKTLASQIDAMHAEKNNKGSYKPYSVNPFTTGLNLLNAGLNTVGGMRNNNRMRNQENLNSFITQQPEALYPNKRMLYGDKSMFAEYGGEFSHGGELPMYYKAGEVLPPIYGKDTRRAQAYSDSMALYNNYIDNLNTIRSAYGKDFESNKNYTVEEKKEVKKSIDKKRVNPEIKEGLNSKKTSKHKYRKSVLGSQEITGLPIGSINKQIFEKNIKEGSIPGFDVLYHTDIIPTGEHNFQSPGILGSSANPYMSPFPIETNQPTTRDDKFFTAGNGDIFKYRYKTNPLNTSEFFYKYDKPVQPYYLEEDPEPEPLEDKVKEPEPIKKVKINTSEFPLPGVTHRYDGPDKLYVAGPNIPNGAKYMTFAEYDQYMKANEGKYRFNPTPNSVGYIYQPGVGIIKNSDYKPYEAGGEYANGGELPMYYKAGEVLPPIYGLDRKRAQSYSDSMALYNNYITNLNTVRSAYGEDFEDKTTYTEKEKKEEERWNKKYVKPYAKTPGLQTKKEKIAPYRRATLTVDDKDYVIEEDIKEGELPEMDVLSHTDMVPLGYHYFGSLGFLSDYGKYKNPYEVTKNKKTKDDDENFIARSNGKMYKYDYSDNPKNTYEYIYEYKEPVQPYILEDGEETITDPSGFPLPKITHRYDGPDKLFVQGPGLPNGSKYMTFNEYKEFTKKNKGKYNFNPTPNSVGYVYLPSLGVVKNSDYKKYESGGEYAHGGELPMYTRAGEVMPTIYTSNPYDYRIKNYNDSLKLYNTTQKLIKQANAYRINPLPMSWLADYSLAQLQANNHGSYSRDFIYGPYGSIVGRSPASQLPRSTYNTRRADGTFERNMPIDDTTEYARRYHGGNDPQPYSVLHYKKPVQPVKYRKEEPKPKEDPEPIPVPVKKPITRDSFTLGLPVIKHTVNSDSTVQVAGPGVKNGSKTMTFKEYDEFAKNNFKKYNFSSQPNSVGKVYKTGKGIMQYEVGGEVEDADYFVGNLVEYKKGGIYIKPENKGKFTAWADAHGMSVQEAASHVMANKEKYSSITVKRANFAKNASKWSHEDGGEMYSYGGHYIPQDVPYLAGKFVPNPIDLEILANGGMIKRADGTYSKRGLWDNIRANKGSGKKPTKEMLKQENKIKKGYKTGGEYMEGNEYEISGEEVERLRSLGYDVEMI